MKARFIRGNERASTAHVHRLWARLARREGVTVWEVRAGIEAAMHKSSEKPGTRLYEARQAGAFTTPEEFFLYILRNRLSLHGENDDSAQRFCGGFSPRD